MSDAVDSSYRVAEEINNLSNSDDPRDLLNRVCSYYGLTSAAYFGINVAQRYGGDPYLMVTYSEQWINHYKERGFIKIDPVITNLFDSILPVEWKGSDYRARAIRNFFGEASEYGVGSNGLTVPIRGRFGERALFTITNDWKPMEWQKATHRFKRDFHILAYHLHQMVMHREGAESPPVKLANREVECLRWKASGKTEWEIATILGISEKTVRFYISLAVTKLNATNATHAVAKAINQNLFLAPL